MLSGWQAPLCGETLIIGRYNTGFSFINEETPNIDKRPGVPLAVTAKQGWLAQFMLQYIP
jgi:hypothetical protein